MIGISCPRVSTEWAVKCRNPALKEPQGLNQVLGCFAFFFFFFPPLCFVFHEIQGWVGKERNPINFLGPGTFPGALGAENQIVQTHPLGQKVL